MGEHVVVRLFRTTSEESGGGRQAIGTAPTELCGAGDRHVMVKIFGLVAVPPGVTTEMSPVVAPTGTRVVTVVEVFVTMVAGVPLKDTEVAPDRWIPLMVTAPPTAPAAGETEAIQGAPDAARQYDGDEALVSELVTILKA